MRILKQVNALKAEQLSNPPIGPLEGVARLAREYEGGSEVFVQKTALLTTIGTPTYVFEDFYDLFIAQVNGLAECALSDLETAFRDDEISNGITLYMRFLTSAELQINADEYMPFIDEGLSIEQFCNLRVDRFGEEADQLQITALARVFHRQLHILYLDQSAIDQPNIIDIGSEGATDLPTHFLYKPGHYDLLYV